MKNFRLLSLFLLIAAAEMHASSPAFDEQGFMKLILESMALSEMLKHEAGNSKSTAATIIQKNTRSYLSRKADKRAKNLADAAAAPLPEDDDLNGSAEDMGDIYQHADFTNRDEEQPAAITQKQTVTQIKQQIEGLERQVENANTDGQVKAAQTKIDALEILLQQAQAQQAHSAAIATPAAADIEDRQALADFNQNLHNFEAAIRKNCYFMKNDKSLYKVRLDIKKPQNQYTHIIINAEDQKPVYQEFSNQDKLKIKNAVSKLIETSKQLNQPEPSINVQLVYANKNINNNVRMTLNELLNIVS